MFYSPPSILTCLGNFRNSLSRMMAAMRVSEMEKAEDLGC